MRTEDTEEKPLNVTRLTLPMSAVVALTLLLLGLLGTIGTGAWAAARSFSAVEAKLDALSPVMLDTRYYTRLEMAKYHRDLERVTRKDHPTIGFPPPIDPLESIPTNQPR